jgi:hypothetical protein
MNTYKLTRHANNTFSVDTGRDYFEPISEYYFLAAHDIIEHTQEPHPDNTVDELMAIGAMIGGRSSYNGSSFMRSEHIKMIGHHMYKIISKLGPLSKVCDHDYTSEALFDEVYSSIDTGLSGHQIQYNVASIANWIFHGQKLFLERFDNPRDVSTKLFDIIQAKIRHWRITGKGDGLLCVDFDTLKVDLR